MNWFDGSVVEAIQASKSRKSIFLVCITGMLVFKLRRTGHNDFGVYPLLEITTDMLLYYIYI